MVFIPFHHPNKQISANAVKLKNKRVKWVDSAIEKFNGEYIVPYGIIIYSSVMMDSIGH